MASFHPSGDSASFEIIMGFVKVKGPFFSCYVEPLLNGFAWNTYK